MKYFLVGLISLLVLITAACESGLKDISEKASVQPETVDSESITSSDKDDSFDESEKSSVNGESVDDSESVQSSESDSEEESESHSAEWTPNL